MELKLQALAVGCLSYVPGLNRLTALRTGGTDRARYCYAVWLRHLCHLRDNGLPTRFGTVLEMGPGDSLGLGLAALLSAADRYVALDIMRYADPERNVAILHDLVSLFEARAPIPDEAEFPRVFPRLPTYEFPADLLSGDDLDRGLDPARIDRLEAALRAPAADGRSDALVGYAAPWCPDVLDPGSVDLIISQSALEYAPDLIASYTEMARWARPGAVMSHEVDFKSMGRTRSWNGHWSCSDPAWQMVQGRRRNQLNRMPLSRHVEIQRSLGFTVVRCDRDMRFDGIDAAHLAPAFAGMPDADLTTASALIQSRKSA